MRAEFGEEFRLLGVEQVEVAAPRADDKFEDFARGLAHLEKAARVDGEFLEMAAGGLEADELREGELVEGIEGRGAFEEQARVSVVAEGGQALGDDAEIFGAEIGLGEEVLEVETGFVGAVEAEERDGLEAMEDGGEALGGFGVEAGEGADGLETFGIAAGDEVGFGGHERECVGRPVLLGEMALESRSEIGVAGGGGEVGEGEEGGLVAHEGAHVGLDVACESVGALARVVEVEEPDARSVGKGIVGETERGVKLEFALLAELAANLVDEDVGFVGGEVALDEIAEPKQGEFAVAALGIHAREKEGAF